MSFEIFWPLTQPFELFKITGNTKLKLFVEAFWIQIWNKKLHTYVQWTSMEKNVGKEKVEVCTYVYWPLSLFNPINWRIHFIRLSTTWTHVLRMLSRSGVKLITFLLQGRTLPMVISVMEFQVTGIQNPTKFHEWIQRSERALIPTIFI